MKLRSRYFRLNSSSFFIGFATVLLGCQSVQSQTTLGVQFKPTIAISGVLGSAQEVQYTTNLMDSNSWVTLGVVPLTTNPTYYTDTSSNVSHRFYRSITVGLPDTNLAWIPAGKFLMGSPTNEPERASSEGPQTSVTFTEGFFIGRYEVRNADYINTVGATPSDDSSISNYVVHPVRNVTWFDATNYCAVLTAKQAQLGMIPPGWAYRLPTEAEWEYCARAGATNATQFGDELRADSVLGVQAIFNGNFPYPAGIYSPAPVYFTTTQAVGSCSPNAFGLYDTEGNVQEWCLDGTTDPTPPPYPGGSVTNYISPLPRLNAVVRGGGYDIHGKDCRLASRQVIATYSRVSDIGFRVVLAPAMTISN